MNSRAFFRLNRELKTSAKQKDRETGRHQPDGMRYAPVNAHLPVNAASS